MKILSHLFALRAFGSYISVRKSSTVVNPATRTEIFNLPFTHNNLDYCIRRARYFDITAIDLCNRANLPENYFMQYYVDQLHKFPDLSLIAETKDSKEIIGYALGKIQLRGEDTIPNGLSHLSEPTPMEYEGHISSIAVHSRFRGSKAGFNLMKLLHHTMANEYSVDRATLYCRVRINLMFIFYDLRENFYVSIGKQ